MTVLTESPEGGTKTEVNGGLQFAQQVGVRTGVPLRERAEGGREIGFKAVAGG